MGDKPLVSVGVPLYNHARYIEQCLESVVRSGYPNIEIVILNDGSTDNSDEVVSSWISANSTKIPVRYIARDNRGVTATFNEIVNNCRGKYIAWLASDDYLLPGGIEARVNYLERSVNSAVMGDCVVVDEDDNVLFESGFRDLYEADTTQYESDEGIKRQIISRWGVPGPVLMVRRDIYDVIGPYPETLAVEDWDFYLRMVAKNLLGFTDFKVSAYRLHPQGTCKDDSKFIFVHKELLKAGVRNLGSFRGMDLVRLCRRLLAIVKLIVTKWVKAA